MTSLARSPAPRPVPVVLRLQRWIGHLLWYSGLVALARALQRRRATARIVAYHHIVPADEARHQVRWPWSMYTEAEAFAWQMRYIARHYRPIALPDLVNRLISGVPPRPGSIAITLDDGYADQITHALPVLRTAGLPATLAVVAGKVGAATAPADGKALADGDNRQGNGATRGATNPPSAPGSTDRWGVDEHFASADQLRAALGQGVALAAHSATHCDLTSCTAAELHAELAGSRHHLLRVLGRPIDLLSYPFGLHNAAVRAATTAAGYRAALTCEPGANGARTDPLALRRVLVGANPDHFVAAQLAGLLDGPAWLYHGLNRLRFAWPHRSGRRRSRPPLPVLAMLRGRRVDAVAARRPQAACRCAVAPPPIAPPLSRARWPRVSIVVPTYNEHATIDCCLRSVAQQDYPSDQVEVLVVDGGSTDDTVARARASAGVRVMHNAARDAETAKEIGLRAARGDLFMYLDADAAFAHAGWLQAMVTPLCDDPTLCASFTRFVARPGAPALERYLNQHPLQLGPLLQALCVDIRETWWEECAAYTVCCFGGGRVPPVGLCLYRMTALRAVVATTPAFRWIDVAVPELLAQAGHAHVAYVPQAGIHHGRPATLRAFAARQCRDATRTYLPQVDRRAFRYVEFSSPRAVRRLLWWVVRVNLLLPPLLAALRESWRWRDAAGLYGFPLAVLETDAVALTFARHPRGRALLRQALLTLLCDGIRPHPKGDDAGAHQVDSPATGQAEPGHAHGWAWYGHAAPHEDA